MGKIDPLEYPASFLARVNMHLQLRDDVNILEKITSMNIISEACRKIIYLNSEKYKKAEKDAKNDPKEKCPF